MTNVTVGNRALGADRAKTPHVEQAWLTAEELSKHLPLSAEKVREALYELGWACKNSRKPTEESFRVGRAKEERHRGHRIFKWDRKEALSAVREHLGELG